MNFSLCCFFNRVHHMHLLIVWLYHKPCTVFFLRGFRGRETKNDADSWQHPCPHFVLVLWAVVRIIYLQLLYIYCRDPILLRHIPYLILITDNMYFQSYSVRELLKIYLLQSGSFDGKALMCNLCRYWLHSQFCRYNNRYDLASVGYRGWRQFFYASDTYTRVLCSKSMSTAVALQTREPNNW